MMPQPHAIEKKAPIEMQIRLRKTQGSFQDTVLLSGHLHVLSGTAAESARKTIRTTAQLTQRPYSLMVKFGTDDRVIQHQLGNIGNLKKMEGQRGINARIPTNKLEDVQLLNDLCPGDLTWVCSL